jgi:hypothetical protein
LPRSTKDASLLRLSGPWSGSDPPFPLLDHRGGGRSRSASARCRRRVPTRCAARASPQRRRRRRRRRRTDDDAADDDDADDDDDDDDVDAAPA